MMAASLRPLHYAWSTNRRPGAGIREWKMNETDKKIFRDTGEIVLWGAIFFLFGVAFARILF